MTIFSKKAKSPYLLTLLLFIVAPLVSVPMQTGIPSLDSGDLSTAILLHLCLSVCFLSGYLGFNRPIRRRHCLVGAPYQLSQHEWYFTMSYMLLAVGICAAIYSATYAVGVADYVHSLIQGAANIRGSFVRSSENGGVSGFIKIQAYLPLAVLISAATQKFFFSEHMERQKRISRLIGIATIVVIIKALFAQDRMTLVALGVIYGAWFLRRMTPRRLLWIVAAILVASFVSELRLKDYGIGGFLVLYAKLGMVNLQHNLGSVSDLTLGLQTFFHPFLFVLDTFGISINGDAFIKSWAWSPAQNLYGYLFLDFGFFALFVVFALGALLGHIEYGANGGSIWCRSIYFNVLYCIVSFIGVPAFRGPEFWYAILIQFLLLRAVTFRRGNRQAELPVRDATSLEEATWLPR